MTTFYIKRGDTLPKFECEITDEDGTVLDLTTVSTVKLNLLKTHDSGGGGLSGQTNIQKTAAIESPATAGHVSYTFVANDWTVAPTISTGRYSAEWQLTYSGGAIRTAPTQDYLEVEVVEDLD